MKNLKVKFAFLIFISLILSCNKYSECETILCDYSEGEFYFEFVNANGENLLSNGTIQTNDIKVIDDETQNIVEFYIIEDIIILNAFDLQIGTKNHRIQVSEADIFGLHSTSERVISKCCDGILFTDLNILNTEYSFNEETLIYTFLIE